ncbi:MAG: diadenylate cyclase CdaA [Anaerolineaceae bacterium]|nr:diadenylate cyclase CdaA [Anaerolineaceae bacterium]
MEIEWILEKINLVSVIDILLVTCLLYLASHLLRRSHAAALVRGMILALSTLLILLFVVANLFVLPALSWLSNSLLAVVGVAIIIVFQPEIRRALEVLGSSKLVAQRRNLEMDQRRTLNALCSAAFALADKRHGALIVIQRNSNLEPYIQTGIPLDCELSAEMIQTIFFPSTDLHDGAVIIDSAKRIAAAATVLPLTASRNLPDRRLGTRHRAALGISEISDCLCIVVSEETGSVGLTQAGQIELRLSTHQLREQLQAAIPETPVQTRNVFHWLLGGVWRKESQGTA